MIELAAAIGLVVGLLLSAFCSGSETGIYCVNRVRLRVAEARGQRGARRLSRLLQGTEDVVVTTLIGTNLADYLVTASIATLLLARAVPDGQVELLTTAIATPAVLVLGGVLPKDLFRRDADALMRTLARPVAAVTAIARGTGVVWLLRAWTRRVLRWIDPVRAATEAELLPRARTLRLLEEGAVRGGMSPVQREIMERVLRVSTVRMANVMVPRARAAMLPTSVSREDFLRVARMAHFSRIPLYRGDPRKVVGVVSVFDVLMDDRNRPIAEHVRPATFVQVGESVPAALLRMQQARNAMAIVTDAAGHCVGLCTIKDLVEEIVGELEAW